MCCTFTENLISRNRWGGVDIRHGGDPCITNNLICNGLADGVVIGHRGKGTIEGNTMKGKLSDTGARESLKTIL